MQDNYIGDIGDYGKYGLLREVCSEAISLSVNWYCVVPKKDGKQDDGKYISYLSKPQLYRQYDAELFDAMHKIVILDQRRRIERVEQENLFPAIYYSKELAGDRKNWHRQALEDIANASTVFLDPDNGLETERMFRTDGATEKHVKWEELKDYYSRGQNVILYQHRPQMTTKQKCVQDIMWFQENYLRADCVKLLEFPKYTNRFYFMFVHEEYRNTFDNICKAMVKKWGKNGFCREIVL